MSEKLIEAKVNLTSDRAEELYAIVGGDAFEATVTFFEKLINEQLIPLVADTVFHFVAEQLTPTMNTIHDQLVNNEVLDVREAA